MASQWHQGGQLIAVQLARIALRAQRLVVLQRIDQIQVLINSHAPDMDAVAGGHAALQQLRTQLIEARRQLREVPHG